MKQFIISILSIFLSFTGFTQVGINPGNTTPDPSAALDVDYNDKGLLVPRMSQSERDAIANPAYGLLILNTTTNCFNLFIGGWRQICSECEFSPPVAGNNGQVCEGETVQLTASTINGATYNWTGPNSFSSSLQNPSIVGASPVHSGTYSVTATLNGCTSSTVTTSVIVNSLPDAPVAGSNSPICAENQLILTASEISGATYNWTGPNGFTSSDQNPVIEPAVAINAGTYSVIATVNGCNSAAAQISVTINEVPAVPGSITGNTILCANAQNEYYSISLVNGALGYTWTTPSGSTLASGQGTNSVEVDYTVAAGNICVTADGTCGSSSPNCALVSAGLFNSGSQAYSYTGSDQSFVVPAGVTAIQVKSWGGGGGGGSTGYLGASYNTGGPGGYAGAVVSVTPGETISIKVAKGGNYVCNGDCSGQTTAGVYPGGGGASEGNGGGGYSGVFRSSTPLVIAGGGGGGGGGANNNLKRGGAGGGTSGQDGDNSSSGGKGGTQSAGGANGSGPGSSLSGSYLAGGSAYYGGGGGGGYYGGGGGNRDDSWQHMGGGGGSSYVDPSAICPTYLSGDKSSPSSVPNSGDANYSGGVGEGGNQNNGGNGRVVILW